MRKILEHIKKNYFYDLELGKFSLTRYIWQENQKLPLKSCHKCKDNPKLQVNTWASENHGVGLPWCSGEESHS